jgi:hypothetical protein
MDNIAQMYQTISTYVTNPTALSVFAEVLVCGGIIFSAYTIKLLNDIRKMPKDKEMQSKGLEEKL